MKTKYIEGLVVLAIIGLQLRLFWATKARIDIYERAIPPSDQLSIGTDRPITYEAADNLIFDQIRHSINTYLDRNDQAVPDFYLIKDIVERNVSALEEEINLTLSLPLYLGLMGTMIGIVVGLFNMPDLSLVLDSAAKDVQLNAGISSLIGGVKVAMIASFTGLLLTSINSGWLFKGSRARVERYKNELYTLIQTELFPVLNQSMAATLVSLQSNLLLFNQDFGKGLNLLADIFQTSYEAITSQERVLNKLENIDIAQIAKFNINVLKELQKSISEFEQFNVYLHQLNTFVDNSKHLADRAGDILTRTEDIGNIAQTLESRLDQSQALLEFLSRHFKDLENYKNYVNQAVADVGHTASGTFQELRQHIQNSTELVRQFTVDEIDALRNAPSESRTNLGNLAFLETLNKDVAQFKTHSSDQGDRIGQLLAALNDTLLRSVVVLETIQQDSLSYRVRKLFTKKRKHSIPTFSGPVLLT